MEAAVLAKSVLGTLAIMAVQGTVLAVVAVLLLRSSRMRPAWQSAVWLVVLAKFALPWGPAMPWSLADVIEMLRGDGGGTQLVFVTPNANPIAPTAPTASGWWLVLATLWATGTIVVIARAALAYRRTRRAALHAEPAPSAARTLLVELAARVRVTAPRLVVGDPAHGPHVVGLVRPIIAIPPVLLRDETLLRAALLHELAHIRRRDALARILQLTAVAVFWFWPVVRFASRRLEAAREAACDAWALEIGDISRPAYARLLLQMSQLQINAVPLAAPYGLDARVTGVLGPPARPRLGWVHRIALIAWIGLALGGARSAEARGEKTNVCVYTLELAESLRLAHPEADSDGDGVLSHDEACEFQAEVARKVSSTDPQVSTLDDATAELLSEPLCCNCDAGEGLSRPSEVSCEAEAK